MKKRDTYETNSYIMQIKRPCSYNTCSKSSNPVHNSRNKRQKQQQHFKHLQQIKVEVDDFIVEPVGPL